jgi:glutathione S-transferase
MNQAKKLGKYERVFKLYDDVKSRPNIAAYLASERRQKYASWGFYRHYPENDILIE